MGYSIAITHKFILLFLFTLFLVPTIAVDCEELSIVLHAPQTKNYTYSRNIPLEFEQVGGTVCAYSFDGGLNNNSVLCDVNTTFSIDFDDDYNMTFYITNDSADMCSDSVVFSVYRSEMSDLSGLIVMGIVFGLIIISGIVLFLSMYFNNKFKALFYFVSWIFIMLSINVMMVSVNEYVKNPSIQSLLSQAYMVMMYITYFVAFLLAVFFLMNLIKHINFKKQKKEDITYE